MEIVQTLFKDGKVTTITKTLSPQEEKDHLQFVKEANDKISIEKLKTRLNELSQDISQMLCGAVFPDKEERILEFKTLHNQIRELLGKTPREYE